MAAPESGNTCQCTSGYNSVFKNGVTVCENTNSCVSNPCDDQGDVGALCYDEDPPSTSYQCTCTQGFSFENRTCQQQNENVSNSPYPVQAAWSNYVAMFVAQNSTGILAGYTPQSELVIHDFTTGNSAQFEWLDQIKGTFESLFAYLTDMTETAFSVVDLEDASGEDQVFLVWKAAASGVQVATDSFDFTAAGKIMTLTFVLWTDADKPFLTENVVLTTVAADQPGPVQEHWDNYHLSFGTGNMTLIKCDYSEQSVIRVYDTVSETKRVFTGMAGVEEMFTESFAIRSNDCVSLPIVRVKEADGDKGGYVFITVSWPCAGYYQWTDTFWFDENGMITRQNIVYSHYPPSAPNGGPNSSPRTTIAASTTTSTAPAPAEESGAARLELPMMVVAVATVGTLAL